jgi:hypothetical protein
MEHRTWTRLFFETKLPQVSNPLICTAIKLLNQDKRQEKRQGTKDKGQKTIDVTFFGVEIRLPRWSGIKGEDLTILHF